MGFYLNAFSYISSYFMELADKVLMVKHPLVSLMVKIGDDIYFTHGFFMVRNLMIVAEIQFHLFIIVILFFFIVLKNVWYRLPDSSW